ncbi:unnamed protein product [Allacma fusca]|uniref:Bestrophin homolog n=1 Tax=Allacma fusca TaxID=39272 RepID=A0A8J2LXZ4_9HEXA|nr:unnamed protein product [Allacma fusca]
MAEPPSDLNVSEESKLPLMFRLKGTVILKIWWQIVFVIVYTAVVVCIHNYVEGMRMNFPQTLIPVLGVVTGLLLVFRTNTAYDRYWEGRRLWSQMTLNIRTLTRCIWAGVDERQGNSEDIIEKMSAINLLVAFAYSVKNYLREEYSYDEEDMKDLISHLPRFATPSSNQPFERQDLRRSVDLGRKPSVAGSQTHSTKSKQYNLTAHDYATPTNIPIELSYYITSYVNSVRVRGLCDSSNISIMNASLTSLVDCLTGFERILRTPIPLAYSVHLHHSMWLYLLALPYQLVGTLNWWTIPAVTLASFALLGILGIGWEIENPFGYDDNDLPLDDFCRVIRREIQVIVGRAIPTTESWIMSPDNHPLAPVSSLNAEELSKKSEAEIRSILARGSELQCVLPSPHLKDNVPQMVIVPSALSRQRNTNKDWSENSNKSEGNREELVSMLKTDPKS